MMDSPVMAAAARVDAQEREDRIGGAGALFRSVSPPTLRAVPPEPAEVGVEVDVGIEAQRRAEIAVCVRAIARTAVSLAAEAGGHDPRHHRPIDIVTSENIERQLLAVMEAKAQVLPEAFRMASGADEMRKASAISKALDGDKA